MKINIKYGLPCIYMFYFIYLFCIYMLSMYASLHNQ